MQRPSFLLVPTQPYLREKGGEDKWHHKLTAKCLTADTIDDMGAQYREDIYLDRETCDIAEMQGPLDYEDLHDDEETWQRLRTLDARKHSDRRDAVLRVWLVCLVWFGLVCFFGLFGLFGLFARIQQTDPSCV